MQVDSLPAELPGKLNGFQRPTFKKKEKTNKKTPKKTSQTTPKNTMLRITWEEWYARVCFFYVTATYLAHSGLRIAAVI